MTPTLMVPLLIPGPVQLAADPAGVVADPAAVVADAAAVVAVAALVAVEDLLLLEHAATRAEATTAMTNAGFPRRNMFSNPPGSRAS